MGNWILRAVGVLLLASALMLAVSRAPDRPVESLIARWAPPPSEFLDLQGQLVHVRDEGPRADALPLVLLHGTSASLHTWEGWVAALKPDKRVITLDLPGFGLTGPFTGRRAEPPGPDYGGDAMARLVIESLDAMGVKRFAIGGNSLGGEVAWRVATLVPDRVDRLILVDASGPRFTPGSIPLGWRLARVPVLNKALEWWLPRPLVAEGLANVYGDRTKITAAQVDRYFELTLREGNRRALVQRLQQLSLGADAERIATLRLPTLILWGGRDRLIPPEVGEQFERAIPGSRRIVFPALGHVPHEEDPAATVVPVRAFLGLKGTATP